MTLEEWISRIRDFFPFEPTRDQQQALEKLAAFLVYGREDTVFLLRGYAGTGKTSLISALIRLLDALKREAVLMAPTGRAAKVLAGYSGHPASTIHKKIYRKASREIEYGAFSLNNNPHKQAILIIDEASMISNESDSSFRFGSGHLLEDVLTYSYSGEDNRLILMGDTAQLPPIGQSISPAMDPDYLRQLGMRVMEVELTDVVRQSKGSGILDNATRLREAIRQKKTTAFPQLKINQIDVISLSGDELVEALVSSYAGWEWKKQSDLLFQ